MGVCIECKKQTYRDAIRCRACTDDVCKTTRGKGKKMAKIPEKFLVRGLISYSTGISIINNGG